MHFLLYHRDIKLFLLQLLTSLLATVTLPVALIELGAGRERPALPGLTKTSSQTPKMTKKSSARRKQTADWSTHRPRSCFSLAGSRKAEKKVMRLFYILMRPNLSEQLRRSCINSARAPGSENLSELQY